MLIIMMKGEKGKEYDNNNKNNDDEGREKGKYKINYNDEETER